MKTSLVLVSMLATAGATQAQFSTAKVRAPRATQPAVASQPPPAPLVGGSDSCTTPDVLTGTGSFAFDNGAATTGAEGQSTVNCIQFNLISIPNDVWFSWTAPQTGSVKISSCTSTVDTKIAVYAGTTCPAGGATAAACNDDRSPYTLQTDVFFDVTAGQQFLIQVGVSPFSPPTPVPGPGTISIEYLGDTCAFDDGNTEDSIGLTAGGELAWLNKMGSVGTNTTVSDISTAWGTVGGANIPPGQAASVHVWDDPNDDGNPNDAVLVASENTIVANPGTDQLQTVTLTTPVTVSGIFFVGVVTSNVANQFAGPIDGDGCGYRPSVSWIAGAPGTTLNTANLAANQIPPQTLDTLNIGLGNITSVWMLQATCGNATAGTPFCLGDGTATACPCGNNSPVGDNSGCLSSLGTGGKLAGQGVPSISGDTVVLQGSQMPNSSALYFQGTTQQGGGAGAVFGDGLRCAGGVVTRLGTTVNVAGSSQYPFGAFPSVSVKGGVVAPGLRTYQCWYRNAAAFCNPSTFNLSNGLSITWIP
jgi:hypothetical protein